MSRSIWENYKTYRVDRPFIRKNILWNMQQTKLKVSARVRLRIVRAQIIKIGVLL